MPAKIKVTREAILTAALALVGEQGEQALSARDVAARLGCSTQPIFSNFPGMRELRLAVIGSAWELYCGRIAAAMTEGRYPPFKASGMAYITFAVEEPQLFRLLFMRDRIADGDAGDDPDVSNVIDAIVSATGLEREDAARFHREMWIFVHGLAVMFATRFAVYEEQSVSDMLSETYNGLLREYNSKGEIKNG